MAAVIRSPTFQVVYPQNSDEQAFQVFYPQQPEQIVTYPFNSEKQSVICSHHQQRQTIICPHQKQGQKIICPHHQQEQANICPHYQRQQQSMVYQFQQQIQPVMCTCFQDPTVMCKLHQKVPTQQPNYLIEVPDSFSEQSPIMDEIVQPEKEDINENVEEYVPVIIDNIEPSEERNEEANRTQDVSILEVLLNQNPEENNFHNPVKKQPSQKK